MHTVLLTTHVVLLFAVLGFSQSTGQMSGFVFDQNGAAISNATVQFREPPGVRYTTRTDDDGRFLFERISDRRGTLTVSAVGFRESTIVLSGSNVEMQIVLFPAEVSGMVTVTRTETSLGETAASIVALGRRGLDVTAASTLDDKLRQVPGFSLFRRSGSRTANPTTQGVSLRGVGASGASRALVIADGVPLNDPFGGWVYWGRIPSESISQVEILRGPSGDLYGSSAIGGVISIRTLTPESEPFASIETSYGTQRTPFVSAYASGEHAKWGGSIGGEFFRTDGFVIVDEAQRGTADIAANVERSAIVPFIQRTFGNGVRVFASAEFFQERRGNGTRLQTNDTRIRNFAAGADLGLTSRDRFSLRANGGAQKYHQTFSAVAPERNSESLNRLQRVPVDFFGGSGQWTGTHSRKVFFAGFDVRHVRGHSDEVGIVGGLPSSTSDAGGRELTNAIFGGTILPLTSRLTLSGGVRVDWWRNTHGFMRMTSLSSGAVTVTNFPDRSESAFSPRLSALYRFTDRVSFAATLGTGFRRPTLNELYRNFRVGDIVTLANANLRAERATGFEAAVFGNAFNERLHIRTGIFCTSISNNVSNVTLSASPTLIIRQRLNVGRTQTCGGEADWSFVATDDLRISGGYLFVDSRVVSFPANRAQEGLKIPQVASHQFSLQLAYTAPKLATFATQIRAIGPQFDDDQNQFRLRGFTTVDLFASRKISSKIEAFAAAENLFDSKIEAGRTPVLTLGTPRTLRVGVRFRFGGR